MKKSKINSQALTAGSASEINCRGYIIMNVIIIMVIFAAIIGAVVYISSSGLRQALSSNQGANASSMAEAGYRFFAANYLNTTDSNTNLNFDDDKAALLRNFNGRTYVIPNNGSFTFTVKPYWFYNAGTTSTGTNISVQLPGTAPTNFSLPTAGQVKLGDTPGVGVKSFTNGSFNSSSGVFTCTLASSTTLNNGDSLYLVLNPNTGQTIAPGNKLTLNIANYSQYAFPKKDGLIEIGTETRLYRYAYATLSGNTLTLSNLQHSDKSAFSTTVTTATPVSFKKYFILQSRGQLGSEQRTLSINQAITDGTGSTAPVVIKLDNINDLNANFSRSSSITSYSVSTLLTSSGNSAAFSIINSLSTTGSGSSAYKCGAFWYNNNSLINTQWSTAGNLLSYDIQVKNATGNSLKNGTLGLAIRARKVSSTIEPDSYLGLTFMKYNLPYLYFTNGGTVAINAGDTVVGQVSGATGVVQGTPEITSGSWASGNAAGKIRFASVTGTFDKSYEWLSVGGAHRARTNKDQNPWYFTAAQDYIPDGIKPKPADFFPARYNIGPLLLVLWERKADGTLRWLAFKDISSDDYAKGLQDWNAPEGSCASNCYGYDGQIINDDASLYIRVQEKKVVLGSGSAVKVNDINVFYGDDSARYTSPARPGNAISYDIKELRQRYTVSSTFNPVWVPQYLSQWDQSVDFFSHPESGTPIGSQPQFQWDAVNPNVTDISVLKICDDLSVTCTSSTNGTLRLTELVTPDSGTYSQSEIGLIGCGNFTTNPYATAGFADFALYLNGSTAGASTDYTGGFFGTSLSW